MIAGIRAKRAGDRELYAGDGSLLADRKKVETIFGGFGREVVVELVVMWM